MRFNRFTMASASFAVMTLAFGAFWLSRSGVPMLDSKRIVPELQLQTTELPKLQQPYVVKVMAISPNDNLNSVGIYLRFDPQKLRVIEVDTLRSFCQFYPEKKFDNQLGSISLACGAPHPGSKGDLELMTITFLPLVEGVSQVSVDGRSVLLRSDGKGTNLLENYPVLEVSPGVSL
jgi:hypothetical protein